MATGSSPTAAVGDALPPPLPAGEGAASSWMPGQSVLIWFSDDTVWHERVLLWPGLKGHWWCLTPDDDMYEEDLSGGSEPTKTVALGENFGIPADLLEPVYRFDTYPNMDRLRSEMRKAHSESIAKYADAGAAVPARMRDHLGVVVSLDSFFNGSFVKGRLNAKTAPAGAAAAVPAGAAAGGLLPSTAQLMGPVAALPLDFVWVAAEFVGTTRPGQEVSLNPSTDFVLGPRTALARRGREWLRCDLVKVEDALNFGADLRSKYRRWLDETAGTLTVPDLFGPPEREPPAADAAALAVGEEAAPSDIRTLWLDYDEQGIRFKEWRKVLAESTENIGYEDWPHDGPGTVMHMLSHMFKFGGDPKQWLERWSRSKGVQDGDRVMHELRVLMDILWYGGTYDQLNLTSLASMETASRRIQSIVDAYSTGGSAGPDWGNSKLFSGYKSPDDLVSPLLRSWAAKKGKEEVELHNARSKMRELRTVPSYEAAGAVTDGALPAPGGRAKGRKGDKGRGRGLQPPGEV